MQEKKTSDFVYLVKSGPTTQVQVGRRGRNHIQLVFVPERDEPVGYLQSEQIIVGGDERFIVRAYLCDGKPFTTLSSTMSARERNVKLVLLAAHGLTALMRLGAEGLAQVG